MKPDLNGNKNVETPFLKIRGNCLEIQNTIIQLSNISLISTVAVTPEKFPILSLVLIVIGFVLIENFGGLAAVAILSGAAWLIYWYYSVEKVKELKRLTIITNSGNVFPIVFDDEKFLDRVVTVMTDIIRDPVHARDITINVKDCTFSDDASVIRNMHER